MLWRVPLSRVGTRRSAHSLSGDAYQFVHKSEIPSYHFQKSLRRLPIPKLPDTCNRYLASAKVVLSPSEYQTTERLIRDFEKTSGPQAQEELVKYDKAHKNTSYVSEAWFDLYLRARVPLPVNYNPFMMYAPDPQAQYNHQLTRATNLCISYARIKRALDNNVLAPEVFHLNPAKSDTKLFRTVCKSLPPSLSWFGAVAFKAFPLDMSQYKSLFNGTRVPGKGKDSLYNDPSEKHFVVLHNGRMFAVRLFDDNGNILPADHVHSSLAFILTQGKSQTPSIGPLSTLERDEWAEVREQLLNEGNSAPLKTLDGSLFVLSLDSLQSEDHKRLVNSLLVGDDASNRWFDKCFSLIVDGNGQATINFEHSWGDGVAVLRLMEESFKDSNTNHFVDPHSIPDPHSTHNVHELKFNLSESLRGRIAKASGEHVERFAGLDFGTIQYRGLNRDSIKKHKLSPDSIMQLAIQMAFFSLYKEWVPTYESCSTAAFLKGRTECIRSATSATRAAVEAIAAGKEVRPLLTECSTTHAQLVKDASLGQGFDRHLLALKETMQCGKEHDFFRDPTYSRMSHFVLSTSTLSTETIVFGGFGPVVRDGLGIGYNVSPQMLGGVVSSYKEHRSATDMAAAVHKALDTLKHILEKN